MVSSTAAMYTIFALLFAALVAMRWDDADERIRLTMVLLGVGWGLLAVRAWGATDRLTVGPTADLIMSVAGTVAVFGAAVVYLRPQIESLLDR